MKRIFAFGLAAAMAAGLAVSQPAPAKADGGLITGLIIGGIAGHVITRHHGDRINRGYWKVRRNHYSGHWRTRKHMNWCHRQYKSYDSYDNTWLSYSGHIRQCRSPYWR